MTFAYEPEAWREVYLMLGGAVAALAGLLFVAISIKIDIIREAPHWRTRAFGNTFAFVGLLILSTLVMLPQDKHLLGIELILVNVGLLLFVPVRALLDLRRQGAPRPMPRLLAGMAAWTLGALAGVSLLAGVGGGMYLLTAGFLALIWLGVLNAWSFITVNEGAGGS